MGLDDIKQLDSKTKEKSSAFSRKIVESIRSSVVVPLMFVVASCVPASNVDNSSVDNSDSVVLESYSNVEANNGNSVSYASAIVKVKEHDGYIYDGKGIVNKGVILNLDAMLVVMNDDKEKKIIYSTEIDSFGHFDIYIDDLEKLGVSNGEFIKFVVVDKNGDIVKIDGPGRAPAVAYYDEDVDLPQAPPSSVFE